MNDLNAVAEGESTETVGIWRRAVSSEFTLVTIDGQKMLPNDST